VSLDAQADAPQSLACEQNHIVEATGGEAPRPMQSRGRIRGIDDLHERIAQHLRSASLQQTGEDVQLAAFGYGDAAAGKRFRAGHKGQGMDKHITMASR
jgi:hypothetical protein